MTLRSSSAPVTIAYGPDASQVADLHLPSDRRGANALPVVVVVHGGFWRAAYGRELGAPLAADLAAHGVAAWNVEYRRMGNGGGWPHTLLDVASAVDVLVTAGNVAASGVLDLRRVVAVGHSAGGHLAMWLASRHKLPTSAPGSRPQVSLIGAVSQAGVLDLSHAAVQGLGRGAVVDLLGGSPEQVPDRYAVASPSALVPIGVPSMLVHGEDDDIVPISQSHRYAVTARSAGDVVEEAYLPDVDHDALIDVGSAAWTTCREAALRYTTPG